MTDHPFDRIARLLSRAGSRRQALAVLAALPLARARPAFAASQIETAACGEAGAVCTQLMGCCSGMVCATSYTNPAYGVCVAGEGDMLPVSDDIVVPGAEGIADELALEVTDAGASDADSVLAAQDAEIESRKAARDARQSSQRSRHATQQARRRANHGDTHEKKLNNQLEKRNAAATKRSARALKRKPRLTLSFTDKPGKPEILQVRNHDDVSVTISRVESILDPDVFATPNLSIAIDDTYLLESGTNDPSKPGLTVWTDQEICTAGEGDGVILTVAKSGVAKKHRLKVLCP
jgi:hypothetical protein